MILEDGIGGERLRQVEAVFYLERLADRTLLGAGTHGAWRHSPGLTDIYGLVTNITRHPLLPEVQVDGGQGRAGNTRVEEGVGHIEQCSLDVGDSVTVVTHHLGQAHLPDLVQLGLGEPDQRIAAFIPEPVAFPQVSELDSNDAGKCWTHQSAMQRCLRQAT